jgi:hypothetical protein
MKLITKTKYYSFDVNKWETKYTILYIVSFYKLEKFNMKKKYSFKSSKNILKEPIIYKPKLTKEETIIEFGNNKWSYPLEPYIFID